VKNLRKICGGGGAPPPEPPLTQPVPFKEALSPKESEPDRIGVRSTEPKDLVGPLENE